jgi:exopolysaccharide biosynthesis polyprenyl glycosylphosphotransferase
MPRLRILFLILGDFVALILSYAVASLLVLRWYTPNELDIEFFFLDEAGILKIVSLALMIILCMYSIGLYDNIRVRSRRKLAEDLMLVFGFAFLLQALISYSKSPIVFSRSAMLSGTLLAFFLLILWRSLYSMLLLRVIGRQRVLFLGDTGLAHTIAAHIVDNPEKGFEVIGCVRESNKEEPFPGGPTIPIDGDLQEQIVSLAPDRISVSGLLNANDALSQKLLWCSTMGFNVESLGDLYENLFQRVAIETITINQLVFSPAFRVPAWMTLLQEVYDRLIAAVGLVLCWPLMLLTALAVRLDSEGPALLRQKRVGRNGTIFEILKFRSMYVDADKRFGRTRASTDDPRITRVGRFIRVTRLDELPQFINVLRGDMALVGPRPEMPVYVTELSRELPIYTQRLRVKPGITGWAQLHHQPEISAEDTKRKIEYDLYYIKNMSPLIDFLIMFYTFKAVILRTGAR